jgi:hypothetical protein
MTIPRMLILLLGLSAIGSAVVAIRVEESRVLRRIQQLQNDEAKARQEIRAQEMKLWSLRAPPNIRERSEQLRPKAEPPAPRRAGEPNRR